MRYRGLDADGDYSFGGKGNPFLVNSPETVGQAVATRLKLMLGEWFPDPTVGVDYLGKVLGSGTQGTYDQEIQRAILDTTGVTELIDYLSYMDTKRGLHVSCTINTLYGVASLNL